MKLFELLEQYEDVQVPEDAPVIAVVRKKGKKAGAAVRVKGEKKFTAKGARCIADCVAWAAEHLECDEKVPAAVEADYSEYAHVNGRWWPVQDGMVLARKVET